MTEKLCTRLEWLIIEDENYKIINDNEVHYELENGYLLKVRLNLHTYDRIVEVYDDVGEHLTTYNDLSKERIVEKIMKYESWD